MNEFHRQVEKEQQDRKYRDLEIRFHQMESERNEYRIKYNDTIKLLSNKTVELQSFKESVDYRINDLLSEIRNI
jgi:hypothetical protein